MKLILLLSSCIILLSCENAVSQRINKNENISIEKSYWSDGLAEVSRYDLTQQRYGESREGNLIQVFVAEDFLLDKQVKNESYESKHSTRVLKRIETRDFNTGIYSYHMFDSSFTPFDVNKYPKTIKVSSSSQEWCGTTYSQLNLEGKNYNYTLHSYFEKEADILTKINSVVPEEELFTKIRLSPELLPIGKFDIIISQIVSRFLHLPAKSYKANGKLIDYKGTEFSGDNLKSYEFTIPELERTVRIIFDAVAPYIIRGWTDSYPSYFDPEVRTTKAVLTHQIKEAYWSLNSNKNSGKRQSLGLD